ncbi:MAG: DEAD/DEAH box helicase [Crocinitomicaceae bacterium]|nr:DEAD/DEAH box helicase [Crocinitomicaceae bacterium]
MKDIQTYLTNAGHTSMMDVQTETVEAVQEHPNVVVYSKTGSGKTLAFLLSLLSQIDSSKPGIQGLILAPSRELCLQIEDVFRSLKTGLKATICYGGHSMKAERNSLSETPALVIGTPGRIADHIDRRNLDELEFCSFLVIDEFDKCLEFGFENDMDFITQPLKHLKNKVLASATRLERIPDYLNMHAHHEIDKIVEDDVIKIEEHLVAYDYDIVEALGTLLKSFGNERAIVFCNYREVSEDVSTQLKSQGVTSTFYHGGLEQDERERALIKFRNGSSTILVCTDLGARGLDIPDVMHIVHYQYPGSEDAFTHRKGRTARMSAHGHSYLFKGENNQLPMYIKTPPSIVDLNLMVGEPVEPEWETLYFSAGKKDKVNKIDIVGFLSKKGDLGKGEIGLITVQDRACYVAVKRAKIKSVLQKINGEKVKGKRLKIAVSK